MEPGQQFQDDPYARVEANKARAKADKEYGAAYRRGRTASKRYTGGGFGPSPLERADSRGEPDAWYDGYHDHANWE